MVKKNNEQYVAYNLSKGYNKIIIPTNLMNVFKMYPTKSISFYFLSYYLFYPNTWFRKKSVYFQKENLVSIIDKKKSLKKKK